MEKKETETNWIERAYNKLIAPKTIKFCGYSALVTFFGLMSLAIIVAVTLGPPGYNIIDNWISDMGNHSYTPAPFLLDAALICTGILLIPFHFYMERHLAPIPRVPEDLPAPHRMTYRFMELAFFFSMLGSFGMIMVGIFSEDRDIAGLHFIFSVVLFGSFAISALFMGLRITFLQQSVIPKPFNYILGIYGMCVPSIVGTFAAIYLSPLWEWIIFFVLLGLITPIFLTALRHAESQLK
jgi:hypothetical membrane protein